MKDTVYFLRFDKSATKPSRCLLIFLSLSRPIFATLWFEKCSEVFDSCSVTKVCSSARGSMTYRSQLQYFYNAVWSIVQEDGNVAIESNGKN